jgi:hypothetical protein
MSRVLAYGFGLGLVVLVAAPGAGDPNWDSFPLSTYPMFARPRRMPLLYFAEGTTDQGDPVRLPPELVANEEVMQAAASVRRAVVAGPEAQAALCREIARRAAASSEHRALVEVSLVSARFEPVRYFRDGPEPRERTVHERCRVGRTR